MQHYNNRKIYRYLERITSVLILCFQAVSLFRLLLTCQGTSWTTILIAFIIAYLLTDFINGLVHMYMDNNTQYASIAGPFIATFHLHHAKLQYSRRHPLQVYFYESGTKFWLLAYLFALTWAQYTFVIPDGLNICLVSIGILSSVAEVSHYWCHNAQKNNTLIFYLQKYRILLSRKHHLAHHKADNTHYAFLNGMTDCLLNKISLYCYDGYKNYADKHTKAYVAFSLSKSNYVL